MNWKRRKCCECKKMATWVKTTASVGECMFFCDDCVPREAVDENGNKIPSDEYEHYENGIYISDGIKHYIIEEEAFDKALMLSASGSFITNRDERKVTNYITMLFDGLKDEKTFCVDYGEFMSNVGMVIQLIREEKLLKGKEDCADKFYNYFKIMLQDEKIPCKNLVLSEKNSTFAKEKQ